MLGALAQKLDSAGLRRFVAAAASIPYAVRTGGSQHFVVDAAGHWVNQHAEATIVSPSVHTAGYAAYRALVLDNWAWQYRPEPGDTVFDIGAGVGEEAVIFSHLVGSEGKIVSVEAHPGTCECLRETIRRSSLSNVLPICCAIAERDGTVGISESEDHIANSILTKGELLTSARSLDSLSEQLQIGPVALLKMNIEGAERLAVTGMDGLANRVRHVVISCHDFISDRGGSDEFRTYEFVRSRLEGLGFELSTRPTDPRPWIRYYLYGRNRSFD